MYTINNVSKGMASTFVNCSIANECWDPPGKDTREEKILKPKMCSLSTTPNTMANVRKDDSAREGQVKDNSNDQGKITLFKV